MRINAFTQCPHDRIIISIRSDDSTSKTVFSQTRFSADDFLLVFFFFFNLVGVRCAEICLSQLYAPIIPASYKMIHLFCSTNDCFHVCFIIFCQRRIFSLVSPINLVNILSFSLRESEHNKSERESLAINYGH